MSDKRRLLLAKPGLACHDTGIVTVAQKLRDAGYAVIYLGLHNHPDEVVKAGIEEGVDGIGVSYLPRACLQPLIDRRALAVLKTSPALPLVNYVALYRSGGQSSLMSSIANLAQEVCDFSNLFQTNASDAETSNVLGSALFGAAGVPKTRGRTTAQ